MFPIPADEVEKLHRPARVLRENPRVQILESSVRLLLKRTLNSTTTEFDLHDFATVVYFMCIEISMCLTSKVICIQ